MENRTREDSWAIEAAAIKQSVSSSSAPEANGLPELLGAIAKLLATIGVDLTAWTSADREAWTRRFKEMAEREDVNGEGEAK